MVICPIAASSRGQSGLLCCCHGRNPASCGMPNHRVIPRFLAELCEREKPWESVQNIGRSFRDEPQLFIASPFVSHHSTVSSLLSRKQTPGVLQTLGVLFTGSSPAHRSMPTTIRIALPTGCSSLSGIHSAIADKKENS